MKRSNHLAAGGGDQPPLPAPNQPSLENLIPLPKSETPRDILNYLLRVQQKTWGKTIVPTVPYKALQVQLNILLKTYSPKTILITIVQLANVAKGPFSFVAVGRYLKAEQKCVYTPSSEKKSV